jgi:hypothetical protein
VSLAWWPDQQDAGRRARAHLEEALGVAQEGDQLHDLRLHLVDARHVRERRLHVLLVDQLQPRAAEQPAHTAPGCGAAVQLD